ncbi:phage terminase large subunit [Bradyrhizobium diazoefficiens]
MAQVVIPYTPRPQFEPYHDRTERFAKIVAHRRFGKTVGCINDMIRAALTIDCSGRAGRPPRFAYIAPTYTQAKDVAWSYLKYFSSPIPGIDTSESELRVEYPNGARIRLYGADNYDRLRGLYHDGVTIDEPAQMDPRAWPEVIRPTLSDYAGWGTFIGTPAGRDWFYKIDRNEDGSPADGWFRLTLKASETGIIKPGELESLRAGLTGDQYEREFECSFDAAIVGAYYAEMMAQAKRGGRIGRIAADPLLPLRAFHDIGGSGGLADAYTIWIVQWVDQEIRVLDYYESVGQVLAYHVNWMRDRGYEKAINYLPHDGVQADKIQGKKYEDHWREAGFQVEPSVKNQGKGAAMIRVEALRRLGNRIWWNEATTEPGRNALIHYHEKRDEERNVGLGPVHDWSSHASDALGMMACCYEEPGRAANFNRVLNYPRMGVA